MDKRGGYQAMITQHAWMFLSSFEKLRAKLQLIDTVNMAHLGARGFDEIGGEVVQTTSFVMRSSHAFTVSDACIGCGKCVQLCPLNNIRLDKDKPVWGSNCTHCMACICYCPKEAIEYGKRSVGKPRYHFEALGMAENIV